MSVTVFPVLARLLHDRHMTATPLGAIALACAAVNDVTACYILAVVGLVTGAGSVGTLGLMIGSTG